MELIIIDYVTYIYDHTIYGIYSIIELHVIVTT